MNPYTPTTQQIRDSYRSHDTLQAAAAGFTWEQRAEEFDRWLEGVKADAWDEGYERAESDHYGTGFWTKSKRSNPYRTAVTS